MSTKKRELEIVYNLVWKNKPANGDEKSNMVGILDIPATTLDWKTFKSYLLKNSGAADENVKVSYIDSEDREKTINSQLDFEIALYTFRHKARMSEIITLKLDCINSKKSGVKSITKGLSDVQVKIKPKAKKTEEPPEWFLTYMKKFKDELLEEISAVYSSKAHQMHMYHARKLKADSYKRARKTPLLLGDTITDKELSKSAKIERKLESKLEKLEHKTMKIKAKKMALRGSSDSDVGRSSGRNETTTYLTQNAVDSNTSMNASVIKKEGIPHLSGGESYCQTWEICNSGTLPWTSDTELRYAWGSQALKPINKEVPCPPLQPGDTGTIAVFLDIPKIPGTYECYWHFYHKGRRFGHWLGCEVVVDPPPVKNVPYIPSPTYDVINIQDVYELVLPTTWTHPKKSEEIDEKNPAQEIVDPFVEDDDPHKFATCFPLSMLQNNQNFVENKDESKDLVDGKKDLVQEAKAEANAFSDTDNQSIISISDSNSSVNSATSEDFVMLKMCKTPKSEKNASLDVPPTDPNLTKMNVSSLENIDNLDNLFTNLSIENSTYLECINPRDLELDHTPAKTKDEYITLEEIKGMDIKDVSTSNMTIQQKPIDLSSKSLQENSENDSGYAYVHYQGKKIPISKKHLSSEYLTTAESVPECEIKSFKIEDVILQQEEEPVRDTNETLLRTSTPSIDASTTSQQQQQQDIKNDDSFFQPPLIDGQTLRMEYSGACGLTNSMMSSTNENRFFVFPQFYPGYEVVPPTGTNYMDPNGLPYQPLYRYNNLGEVIVNDWNTGLNYSSCTIYPNTVTQCCTSIPDSTPTNSSRSCSSVPNSNKFTSHIYESPQSPPPSCTCNQDASTRQYYNDRCKTDASTSFEDLQIKVETDSGRRIINSSFEHTMSSTPTQQPKSQMESKGNNRVGVPDILSGATVVATSAFNTARSVLNMFVPPRNTDCGRWQNGHWITTNPESQREKNLRLLYEMGFYNRDLNATLLARYNDDIDAVVSELLQ